MTQKEKVNKSYSGLLGEQIVVKKGRKGQNVVGLPKAIVKREPSAKKLAWALNLRKASKYAKNALAIPEMCEFYTKLSGPGNPPYCVASNDFLQKPVIDKVDLSGYHGNIGDKVIASATDKVAITSVSVKILGHDGTVIEEGPCIQDLPSTNYSYTATCSVEDVEGIIVTFTVTDIPGNKVEKTITL